jgi:hypothetical protein
MRTRTLLLGGLVGASGGAAVLLGRRAMGDGAAGEVRDRWHVVTVNRPPDQLTADGLPAPLAELGDQIETQMRPAPGNRGTEIAARWRGPLPDGATSAAARIAGEDPRQSVRAALRHSKMLIETGEILQPDTPPTTRRTPTNLPLELAIRRAQREGRV